MAWSRSSKGGPGRDDGNGAPAEATCREVAVRLLGRRALTVAELRRRLERRGFCPASVDAAIAYCAEHGWLDDHAYARQYVAAHASGPGARGPRRLRAELLRRGISREIVEGVLAESGTGDGTDAAAGVAGEEVAEALVRARLRRHAAVDRRTAWRRLWAFLVRRGFAPDLAAKVLSRVLGDAPAEPGDGDGADGCGDHPGD